MKSQLRYKESVSNDVTLQSTHQSLHLLFLILEKVSDTGGRANAFSGTTTWSGFNATAEIRFVNNNRFFSHCYANPQQDFILLVLPESG